jgi:thioesterase domain-containing protein
VVHAHSGEALRCGDLPRALGPDQPFYGLQSIGWTGERAPHQTIEAMAAHYLTEIRTVQPRGPYHLGGICFGGIVALEMAHQLRDAGDEVALLYLLWNTPTDFPSLADRTALQRFRRMALRERVEQHWIAERLRGYRERLRERRGRAKLAYLAQLAGRIVRRVGKASPKSVREQRQAEISRVNRLALARYRARAYAGRVTMVLLSEHRATYSSDPARDFGRLALHGYDIVFLPWQNTEIYREPHVRSLAAHLRSAIGAAARG